jgi:hypothetical protein
MGAGSHMKKSRSPSPELEGAGFFDDIGMVGDLMSQSFKRMFGGAKMCDYDREMPKKMEGAGAGVQQLAHARMSSGGLPGAARTGANVNPGGVAPVAYGNPPQAPKSFKRNGVMLDRAARGGAGSAGAGLTGGVVTGGAAASSKRAERGRKIAMIMREKGMTLPQASAYLKAHGSE